MVGKQERSFLLIEDAELPGIYREGKAASYGLRSRGFMPVASKRERSCMFSIGSRQNANYILASHTKGHFYF